MDLQRYEHTKFELADIIRSGLVTASKAAARAEERVHAEEPWRRLLQRLAEDRFTVVMAGRFNQGKSSLMNAILGTDRLPTGLVPLTSVITSVRYGTSERVLLEHEGSGFRSDAKLDQLGEYVTERGNPGNVKRIRGAEIQMPLELLRRGVYLVDTPGLGSAIVENSQTTERFVPEIDVLVLVTSYQSPVTEDELRFLMQASRVARAVFVVVNKQDTVAPETRAETVAYVERVIHQALGGQPIHAFSLSARDGLEAKLHGDSARVTESGLADFETALLALLTSDHRASLFLQAMGERVTALAHTLPAGAIDPIVTAVSTLLERTGLSGSGEKERAVSGGAAPAEARPGAFAVETPRHACELCQAVADAQLRFLAQYQYAIATYPVPRAEHAARDGFCPLHTWHYEQVASPRGTCTAYPPLLDHVAARLAALAEAQGQGAGPIGSLLTPRCPVCDVRRGTEDRVLAAMVAASTADGSSPDLTGSFCVLHLSLVLSRVDDPARRQALLARHARVLERVAEDLQRYAIRHDALRRDLASKEELDAPLRALQLLVGYKTVNAVFTVQNIV